MGSLLSTINEAQKTALKSLAVTHGPKVKAHNLDQLWEKPTILAPWIFPENLWDLDLWMLVLFLASKHDVQFGITPPLFFVPFPLIVIASLKNSTLEEAVATRNEHCQE